MAEHSLSELAQLAEQLSNNMDRGEDELPRVNRSLNQIMYSAQSLLAPISGTSTGTHEAQASIFLGSRGLDLPYMSNRLEALSSTQTLEPLSSVPGTDIDTFLKNERHNAIISAIEDSRRQTKCDVDKLFWEERKGEWEQQKQKCMSAFANINADSLNITSRPQESLLNSFSYSVKTTSLSAEEAAYAKVVAKHNTEILQGGLQPSLVDEICREAAKMDVQGLDDIYSLVKNLCKVPIPIGCSAAKARSSTKVKTSLVKQARQHLETCYERHMQSLVYAQLERAQLGGVPGLIPLVKAYLGVIIPQQSFAHLEDGFFKGVPIWPLLFYCFRAGGIKAALSAAQENNSPAVSEIVGALELLGKSDSGRLPSDAEKKLKVSYKRNVKVMTDPYKKVMYSILAHSDPEEDHGKIITATDDYIWLKLCMVDCDESKKTEVLTLTKLQNLLYKQYGEQHFNAYQQPFLYTSVLLLTGQVEAGIEFLSRIEELRCHAIHIALILHQNNLLTISSHDAPMISGDEGLKLNLVHLIRLYVRKFENTNLLETLNYYFFLKTEVFKECIENLVLETKEFDVLLGSLNMDGSRSPGIVDRFKIDVCSIAESVAKNSEKKGLHEDAIKLYDLANNHEDTLRLLNQLLSQLTYQKNGSKRDRTINLASAIARRFKIHGHNASSVTIGTLHLLLDLSTFFDLYHQEKYNDCLEVLQKLEIIAFTKSELQSRVNALSSFGQEIKAVISHILLAAMTATYNLYQKVPITRPLQESILNISVNVPPVTKVLKEQALTIVAYAGMIPIRLNADVNAKLVQLEALIN